MILDEDQNETQPALFTRCPDVGQNLRQNYAKEHCRLIYIRQSTQSGNFPSLSRDTTELGIHGKLFDNGSMQFTLSASRLYYLMADLAHIAKVQWMVL